MSKRTIHEIDHILRKTRNLYLGYGIMTVGSLWGVSHVLRFSNKSKVLTVFPLGLILPGILTWVHVLKTCTAQEVLYLRIGMDKQYSEVKQNNRDS